MATIENSSTLKDWLKKLEQAIKAKNRKAILNAYDVFSECDFDWAKYPNYFKKYDSLVDEGNEVLYS